MLPRFVLGLFVCASLLLPAQVQDTDPFMRHPAVHPDGQSIAFSYQGDIWVVSSEGGRAERLTIHEADEGQPRWRSDGSQIAFTSDRYGNDDVYVMAAEGSTPTRLTYHSTDDVLGGWTPNGTLLFTTRRTYAQAEWSDEIYQVSAEGGTPDRLLDAVGSSPLMSPDGRFVAFEQGYNRTSKKGYEGPSDRDIWVYDTESDAYTQITDYEGNDHHPVWTAPRSIVYISEETGTYNVHRQTLADDGSPDGEDEVITRFENDGVRSVSASAQGERLVVERRTDVYIVEDGGTARPWT